MKTWCLCDANTGYCVAFSVYTGASRSQEAPTVDLGYKVVMELMQNYQMQNHHVYADNYFTSVHLAEDLLTSNTYLCGTTKYTRKEFPKTLAATTLQQGQSIKYVNGTGVLACKWRDKRDVYLLTTNDAGEDELRPVRRNKQEETLSVPKRVVKYNSCMGGVDRLDQLRSYYNVG